MIDIFWGCLFGGILFSFVSLLGIRGSHHGAHHSLRFRGVRHLNPITIIAGITVFGGAGILLAKYTSLTALPLLSVSIAIAVVLSIAISVLLVTPLSNSETSVGFSMNDYVGKTCLVTIPIPIVGHGQVMVKMGAGNTCEPAASFDGEAIPAHSRVVVVEVKNHTLFVTAVDH